jgi:hypothetical protein
LAVVNGERVPANVAPRAISPVIVLGRETSAANQMTSVRRRAGYASGDFRSEAGELSQGLIQPFKAIRRECETFAGNISTSRSDYWAQARPTARHQRILHGITGMRHAIIVIRGRRRRGPNS